MRPLAAPSFSAIAPSSRSDGLVIGYLQLRRIDVFGDERSHHPLLIGDAANGVNHFETILIHKPIVFPQHLSLEEPETVSRIGAPAQIHARLVKLELHTPCHQAIERNVNRNTEIEGEVGSHGKTIKLANPLPVHAA